MSTQPENSGSAAASAEDDSATGVVINERGESEASSELTLPLTYWPTFQRVLVTGGAGFLGSHICRTLLREGHTVICLDNLFTSSKYNIRDMMRHPRFEFVRHDVTEPIRLVRETQSFPS